jgi:peptidyl-prolyl cis-trans isomerase C
MRFLGVKILPVSLLRLSMIVCLPLLASPGARAQQTSVSPAANLDLTKPSFDTQTPSYDVAGLMAKAPQTVVAEVDGRPITLGQVGDTIRDLPLAISQRPFDILFEQARRDLIERQAMVVRAHQTGVDDDPQVKRQMQTAADQVLSNAFLMKELSVRITEDKLLAAYDKIVKGKPGEDQVRFRLILVGTEKEALDAIKEIQGGADFAAVARRISKDPTAQIGGEVAFAGRDGLTPEIGAVAFSLPPGQMAPYPVRSVGAWYVVKTEERRNAPTPPFAAVRGILTHYLQRQNVVAVIASALDKVTVREYAITGKEPESDK